MSSVFFYVSAISILVLSFGATAVYGHTSVNVDQYEIEVGWEEEPPLVGFVNAITIEISELGEHEGVKTGVTGAFHNLDATVKFGGEIKSLDINSDPKPGHYFSKIIPTKTGSFKIELNGEINGVTIDVEIPLEDIENTAILDFPSKTVSSTGDDVALRNSIKYLQEEFNKLKSNSGETTVISDDEPEIAYNFSVLALSLSVSGVVIGITAMLKRNQ